MTPRQGEVWWAEGRDKRRPVLVVTRDDVIGDLTTIIVAPVTTTIRDIPTEIVLDERDGLREKCVASFDNLWRIPTRSLTTRVAESGSHRQARICRALAALADCRMPR